ncbi:enoyl-CoA hydratase/isomerase family protein [Rhodococcus sp. 14C212]|uniref:enoyl-CoA hydratase-related protein n=1 Tax=Rhodococcus sp. 14C212 TaxID=2711209 RepID=UPI0013EB18E2|nr:enoyl-CoA hydratase/isomerase family protein [Rhodococcus sp. 14C212]
MSVVTTREDRVGIITLDRPPANAFDEAQAEALAEAVTTLGEDPAVRAVLIRSARRIFCGGADIAMMESWSTRPDRGARLRRFTARLQDVFARLEALPKPSVAALAGAATGGGLELALACDFRVAGASVKLGLPEVGIGLLPGAGGTQRLTRLAGPSVAHRLVLGAELVTGREAERLGIVQWATDADVETEARALADRLAQLPPAAYAAAKRCIVAARGEEGFARELDEISRLIETPDTVRLLEGFVARAR